MVRVTVPELYAVYTWMQSLDVAYDTNETLMVLDDFSNDFSVQAAELLGAIKTSMLNAADAHAAAVRSVYNWCDFVIPVLGAYIQAREAGHTGDAATCLAGLMDGQELLASAKEKLTVASRNVNAANGKLRELLVKINADFDPSTEYYKQLKARTEEMHWKMGTSGAKGALVGGAGHIATKAIFGLLGESSAAVAAAAESATVILGPLGFVLAVVAVSGACIYMAKKNPEADFGPAIQEHLDVISTKLADVAGKVQMTQAVLTTAANVIEDDKTGVHEMDTTRRLSVVFVQIRDSNLIRAKKLSETLIAQCTAFKARHPTSAA
ncbi:hypothetical protein SDRG_17031 [Saprolegnia diclina VS20]|uniref:Uncharacterized protein n=1 Tax=Saprolegnia diclina (strain VS20) TaxID=1156394 RepID=T0PS78_SAPDV|nr:hypothetical protein SDRG_17031 [Saprolegnia diclina VS20]EQC25086.1 hypothetical protein SDRG_17031 [Saprolegnia diclina VS20]|eukprot:XP_008621486.1 hypothetical protein SDRG_17031 [Saprolegnia diclina VS20]